MCILRKEKPDIRMMYEGIHSAVQYIQIEDIFCNYSDTMIIVLAVEDYPTKRIELQFFFIFLL